MHKFWSPRNSWPACCCCALSCIPKLIFKSDFQMCFNFNSTWCSVKCNPELDLIFMLGSYLIVMSPLHFCKLDPP